MRENNNAIVVALSIGLLLVAWGAIFATIKNSSMGSNPLVNESIESTEHSIDFLLWWHDIIGGVQDHWKVLLTIMAIGGGAIIYYIKRKQETTVF